MDGRNNSFLYNWKLNLLKGVLALMLGISTLLFPQLTLITIVKLFGAFAVAGGILVLVTAYMNRQNQYKNFWLLEGIFDIVFGIIILAYSEAAMSVLMILIGFWAIFMGVVLLMVYSSSRKFLLHRGIFLITALFSIVFGILVIVNPFEGVLAVSILIGIFAILYGVLTILTSIKLAKT